ncbi:BA3454 family stress response protein [Aneurinibacillus sp. Ricciae_BoGa-3]|nr:BA3454 family stress response protein [Aneurinibacillus sp. Ricciae_BoGa-3]WCK55788.1 BA3454 family stress response protein [Aneurinibacillus sp. Ricciae_BoGa-3]
MVEITVTVNYRGEDYQTNVIVDRRAKKEEVLRLAQEQVRRQWRQ